MNVWVVKRTYTNDGETLNLQIIGVYKNQKTQAELAIMEMQIAKSETRMSHITQDEFEVED